MALLNWVGGVNIQKKWGGRQLTFCIGSKRNMRQFFFSLIIFVFTPASLYPVMSLDKKRNKVVFFFVVKQFLVCS